MVCPAKASAGRPILLPWVGIRCRLFAYEELLPDGRMLLRVLLRLLLLHVYLRVLWRGEAGRLERNPARKLSNPPPETSWPVGFLFWVARTRAGETARVESAARRFLMSEPFMGFRVN